MGFQGNEIIKRNKDNKVEMDRNHDTYLNKLGKADVLRPVGRYVKQAQKNLQLLNLIDWKNKNED